MSLVIACGGEMFWKGELGYMPLMIVISAPHSLTRGLAVTPILLNGFVRGLALGGCLMKVINSKPAVLVRPDYSL